MGKSSLEEFIEFAKQEYGNDIFLDVNTEADTFEKIFTDKIEPKKRKIMYKVTYGNKYVSNTEETKVATGQSDLVTIALDF